MSLPDQGGGFAPEVLQARARALMEAPDSPETKAREEALQSQEPVFWAYIDGKPVDMPASKVQAYIFENHLHALQVCPLGSTEWSDAAGHGFKYPEKEEGSVNATPLGTPLTPQEEKLETFPDDELVNMAILNLVQVPKDENGQLIRSELVKALVPHVQ